MIFDIISIQQLKNIIHIDNTNKLIRHPFFISNNHIIIDINSEYITAHKANINPINIDNVIDFFTLPHLNKLI
jgi:hypothetical protein